MEDLEIRLYSGLLAAAILNEEELYGRVDVLEKYRYGERPVLGFLIMRRIFKRFFF